MNADIDKLRRVPLREVWRHEAADFTTWLRDNVDVLNDQLGLGLVAAERERSAGAFSVDLVAEGADGEAVVIENQLEKSDHDHLGKVLTYLVNVGARTAVWIVSDPRPEHVKAVAWLNESTSASFYLVKVEAIRIGDSPAAPLLTLIVGPSAETRAVGETKRELAERHHYRLRFWEGLLAVAKQRTQLHANISPGYGTWISAGAGRSGFGWNYVIHEHDTSGNSSLRRSPSSRPSAARWSGTLVPAGAGAGSAPVSRSVAIATRIGGQRFKHRRWTRWSDSSTPWPDT